MSPSLSPKKALMPAIFPTYRPLKHPPDFPLITRRNAILIVYLFSPNFPCNPNPLVPARLYPSLVTPKNLIPLLVRPVLVLLCPFLPLLAILIRKRTLLAFNPSAIPFFFKGCSDCLLSAIKTKDSQGFQSKAFRGCLEKLWPIELAAFFEGY